jgi:hypothetical protein
MLYLVLTEGPFGGKREIFDNINNAIEYGKMFSLAYFCVINTTTCKITNIGVNLYERDDGVICDHEDKPINNQFKWSLYC